jgi:hypothetical protein
MISSGLPVLPFASEVLLVDLHVFNSLRRIDSGPIDRHSLVSLYCGAKSKTVIIQIGKWEGKDSRMKEVRIGAGIIVCNQSIIRDWLAAYAGVRGHAVRQLTAEPSGLTDHPAHPKVGLLDEHALHSRTVSLFLRRGVGVYPGLSSELDPGTQRPTRHTARWVFPFAANKFEHRWRSGQRAGLQNLYSRVRIPPGAPTLQKKRARPRYCRMAREQRDNA